MEKKHHKKIIAVSGGADSMFLLNQYKEKDIVVAYVNYNIRNDVNVDFQIIKNFCKKNDLKLEVCSIKENYLGNFQKWARNKRYIFFKKIYDKYQCDELIIAHHKDDFLETAIMQWSSKRNPYLFGMNKTNNIFGMNISRPLIFEFWKTEIYNEVNKLNIPFNDDYTNFDNKYFRNKIRIMLNQKSILSKEIMLKTFKLINVEKSIKKIEIIKKYIEWENNSFNVNFLINNDKYFDDLIFKFLNENLEEIKINANILKGIKAFLIVNNGNKTFLLSNNKKLLKLNNNIIIN